MVNLHIITVHLNNLQGLKLTLNSVYALRMYFSNWRWVIKDGLSIAECLKSIQEELARFPEDLFQLIQEKDTGIYDAMNQALETIEEEDAFCLFLNAGDYLSQQFIDNIENIFSQSGDADIIYGNYLKPEDGKLREYKSPESMDFAYILGKTVNHQSMLIRAKWLKKYPFHTNYAIAADWVQLFEILKNEKVRTTYFDLPFVVYEGGGYSEINDAERLEERQRYLQGLYSPWELASLQELSRLRTRKWYPFLIRSLDSPKRSKILTVLSKYLK